MSNLKESLNEVNESLRDLHQRVVSRLELFPYEDVLECIISASEEMLFDCHVFVRHKKFFSDAAAHESDGYILLPHYSFSLVDGEFSRHTENGNLAGLHNKCLAESSFCIELENVVIHFNDAALERLFWRIGRLIAAHFHTSVYDEILRSAARRYRHNFSDSLKKGHQPDVEQLFRFLLRTFSVGAAFYSSTAKTEMRLLHQVGIPTRPECRGQLEPIVKFTSSRKRKSHGIFYSKGEAIYYLSIPVRSLISEQSELLGVLILTSKSRISPLCDYFLADALNEVFLKRLFVHRSALITDVTTQIAKFAKKDSPNWTIRRRAKEFRDLTKTICFGLRQTTNAHSCTVRLFDQQTQSLTLAAVSEEDGAGYDSVIPRSAATGGRRRIKVATPFRSVNAYSYSKTAPGEYVYIRDVTNISESLRNDGLEEAFRTRSKTVSEFVVPLYWGGLRVGVLNLEADFESAFELDDTFIVTMAFLMTQAWAAVHSSADRYWLSQISFTHLATHELADFRRSLEPRHQESLDSIVDTLSTAQFGLKEESSTLFEAILFAESRAKELDPSCDPKSILVTTPAASRKVLLDAQFAASLRVIFDSIIRNAHKHSHLAKDRVSIDVIEAPGAGRGEILIEYSSNSSPADPDDAKFFFYRPLQDSDGLHFGMFLIGAHVRLLGGHVEVHRNCLKSTGYGPLRFLVRLPFIGVRR
ncbi:hypothetical protein RXV86_09775 [Alisedimentitalea sp. MJ-SS2]|uniref:hypothetical protein n=1 Tax=Aliisedimentitalea sp. MJ-SS2 TaxID=3049795 RepID=UPI002914AD06|nr:hypothetical protein [Alisedimentitalea sp. MJ-SS2]MDU8927672.1 hypothetical protein [Alisedimentitalea sp. MJ-SS2]